MTWMDADSRVLAHVSPYPALPHHLPQLWDVRMIMSVGAQIGKLRLAWGGEETCTQLATAGPDPICGFFIMIIYCTINCLVKG